MIWLLSWLIYGIIVGGCAKAIHPGKDPGGLLSTVGIGIVGSYIGGILNFLFFGTGTPFSPSGLIMGIIGAVIFCWIYKKWKDHSGD